MSLVYTIRWKMFQSMLTTYGGLLKVQEMTDRYILYIDNPNETFRCSVLKNADDPAKDFQFVEMYLSKPNVIKIIDVVPADRLYTKEPEAEKVLMDDEILEMVKAPNMLKDPEVENIEVTMPEGVTKEGESE